MDAAPSLKTISAAEALKGIRRPRAPGHGLDETGQFLDIGRERITLADVATWTASGLEEKDFASNFATAGLFGAGAAAFTTTVVVYGWRDRFWIGAVLLGLIALFALIDIGRQRWHRTYIFDLTLADGTRRRFVTADEMGAARLTEALGRRQGQI